MAQSGTWTSQTLDVSLHDDQQSQWSLLKWKEEDTSNEANAYVRIDILSSSDATLQSGLAGTSVGSTEYKTITLSDYPNVIGVDIKIKFTLYEINNTPLVSDISTT